MSGGLILVIAGGDLLDENHPATGRVYLSIYRAR